MIFDCEALSFSLRQSKFSSGDKRPKFSEPYLEIRKMGAKKDLRSSLYTIQSMKPLVSIAVAITAQLAQTLAAVCVAASFLIQPASGCTGLGIEANDGGIVTGRTLEFGADPQSQIVVFPAGTEFVGTVPKGTGLQFKSKYGFAGANGFGVQNAMIDGLNEQGLSVGCFTSPVVRNTWRQPRKIMRSVSLLALYPHRHLSAKSPASRDDGKGGKDGLPSAEQL